MYLAIDPGKTTGWATYNEDGSFEEMGYWDISEARENIRELSRLTAIICEDWKLRPDMAKVFFWSDMPTSQLIGYCEGTADARGIPFIKQQPSIKPQAYRLSGAKVIPKSNPLNHAQDARVHGYFYLLKQGIIRG
jgi:hypothetical protein